MILLTASKIKKSYGIDTILEDVSFTLSSGDRTGVLGINGAGKTTLFKLITDEISPDEGSIFRNKNIKISYMKQFGEYSSEKNAIDEVMGVFTHLVEMEQQLSDLNKKIEKQSLDEDILRFTELNQKYIDMGGLTYRGRIKSTLTGLGFSEEHFSVPLSSLSGGQRTRVMLAKVLLENADVLLLDEPTNHLDIDAVTWLEDFLQSYPGSILLITHDRYFLDKVTNKIYEIEHHKLKEYNGNYSYYKQKKDADRAAEEKDYALKEKEIKRLEGIIAQQKQWNRERNLRTAESKQKAIDRIEQTMVKPEKTLDTLNFKFNFMADCANDVLTVENVSKKFDETVLFDNVNFEVKKGDRVFIMGANGCGKTTLLKILLGRMRSDSGRFKTGPRVESAYYDQAQCDLDDSKTIFEEISDFLPALDNTTIRSALAVFLFKGEEVFKQIGTLSGGEKARVAFAKLMLSKANFLLLDEPTNHLDIPSKEAIEAALGAYEGTLLTVSHDRYFVNKLATKIYLLSKEGITVIHGDYDEYIRTKKLLEEKSEPEKKISSNALDYKQQKALESEKRKLRTKISRAEERITELEEETLQLSEEISNPEISSDFEKIMELNNILTEKNQELERVMEEWEQYSQELDMLES
ncbi:MAG: ABC-F family ATP-binding cassette domain-containing protein [Clostridia bacterium]|nr:ABC-F family ATP-binding cassette domain-containing protein [Clostridia bacterium]